MFIPYIPNKQPEGLFFIAHMGKFMPGMHSTSQSKWGIDPICCVQETLMHILDFFVRWLEQIKHIPIPQMMGLMVMNPMGPNP